MVVVGTWNLENLFPPGSEYGPTRKAAYESKLDGLAEVINGCAPDVLAVQEVGDPQALADLSERLKGDWQIETSAVFDEHHAIRVGFLSKLPMSDVEQVSEFPDKVAAVQVKDDGTTIKAMPRGALRVRVRANGHKVDIVACHLKSKLLSFPGGRFQPSDENERARYAGYALDQRAAEAVTVRAYANTLLDGHGTKRAVIVLGDLNDGPLAATTQILLGPPGSEIGTHGFEHPDAGDNWRLWNLAPLIPQSAPKAHQYTREAEGQRELIDHILVSRSLLGNGGVTIDTGGPEPPAIGAVPTARRDEPASDHSPLFARFQLGD